MEALVKTRNQSVDVLRGIAMLLVVLGHTMTVCTAGSEQSFFYNIIWSLQMPLFFIISGYVTKYSRGITDVKGIWRFFVRRTTAYMLPWLVWTCVIRGIIFGQGALLNISKLVYSMDSGYWFLFSIYIISLIFGISEFIAGILSKSENAIKKVVLTSVFYIIGAVVLMVIGIIMGMSFLCIKLTLYYMPFYFAGYIFGKLEGKLFEIKSAPKIIDGVAAIFSLIFVFLIAKFNLFTMSDVLLGIIIRMIASITGCVTVCNLVTKLAKNNSGKILMGFKWVGVHSLEVYLTHYLLINLVRMKIMPQFATPQGVVLVIGNFALTLILVVPVIKLLNQNYYLRKVLFGKGF